MSTFSLLGTAYSGLAAARAALETTGQNVANVNTKGYTRQRVEQASIPGADTLRLSTTGLNIGQGVQITGISRLADQLVDGRVRDTAAGSGYWTAASAALTTVEATLGEPGDTGVAAALSQFWSAWQTMGNSAGAGETAAAAGTALLGSARALTDRIAAGATAARAGWAQGLAAARGTVASVNDATAQVAVLNQQILRATASGGDANELVDKRAAALTALAGLAGATVRPRADGMVDVIVGGSTVVSGGTTRTLQLGGSVTLDGTATAPARLEFADAPGTAVQTDGGAIAAQVIALGPAAGGAGGAYAEAAKAYDDLATSLRNSVNTVHRTGAIADGTTNHDFFGPGTGAVTALSLTVLPTGSAGIASAAPSSGAFDGSIADAIAQIGTSTSSPDTGWASYVSRTGAQTRTAASRSDVAESASAAAIARQTSQSSVDLDEETANLVVFQHAYQGAARVLTAIDEMLDTLINRTGLVGRA